MCWRFGIDYPPKIKVIQHRPEYHERWSCLLHSRKGDSLVQHRLHLHTWRWKRLQEAREVHSSSFLEYPQSGWWLFWHFRWGSQSRHFSSGHKSWKFSCCTVILSLSLKNKTNKKWTSWLSLEGTWHKSVSSHCLYYGEWVPVATKIMNLLKKSQPSCLKFLEAKRGEGQQDIIRAEAMMCDLLVIKTYYNPWICLCF